MKQKIKDIMSRDPVIIDEEMTIRSAAKKMAAQNLGMLLVGHANRIMGIITDRDLVVRSLAGGHDPDKQTVRDLIDHPPVTCESYKLVEDAITIMEECKIRRLLITDEHHLPVGVLSIDDIAVRHHDDKLIARALHRIAEDITVPPGIPEERRPGLH